MALRELLLPWGAQPQEATDVDVSTGFARQLKCLWTGAGYWYGPAEGTYSRQIGSAADVAVYGRGRTTFSVVASTSPSGRLPDGSFGTASAGTFLAVVRVPTGTATASLKGGATGDMHIRVTSGANLVFVKRGVSVRITASGVVAQGGVYVVAGSYGAENRLYCNGVLVGVDSGGLVTAQGTAAWVGHDGGAAEDWSDGGIGLIAAWDRQLSTDEVCELSANPWQLFEPQRIWVPVSAGGSTTYTLSAPTYVPGSITSTGLTARVTVTAA